MMMEKEELKEYLRENLEIEISIEDESNYLDETSYHKITVTLLLEDEIISESVDYT